MQSKLPKGMTLRITKLAGSLITTSTSAGYRLGPMPREHAAHPGPKVGDILVVENPQELGQALVTIYNGCGCRFMLYPEAD